MNLWSYNLRTTQTKASSFPDLSVPCSCESITRVEFILASWLKSTNKQTSKNLVQIITYKVQIFPCDTVDDFDSCEILNLDFPASYFLARESFASEFK